MKVLSEKELSEIFGVSAWTIRGWRLKAGLPYFRTAGRVFYRLESVLDWMKAEEKRNSEAAIKAQEDLKISDWRVS